LQKVAFGSLKGVDAMKEQGDSSFYRIGEVRVAQHLLNPGQRTSPKCRKGSFRLQAYPMRWSGT
jgi:hypothetical protein